MSRTFRLLLIALIVLAPGGTDLGDLTVLYSPVRDGAVFDPSAVLLLSADPAAVSGLLISTQWESEMLLPLTTKKEKESFAREFYRAVDPGRTLQQVVTTLQYFRGMGKPDTLRFAYTDTMSIRALWTRRELEDLVKKVQLSDASGVLVSFRGWKDTLLTTAFTDPVADGRALYKVPVRFLAGDNAVYCAPDSRKDRALEVRAALVRDHVPVESRESRFHNSPLEQGCATCHEGLPSAGSGMTAECASCHAASAGGVRHAPVEMNACTSCHGWSAEKNAVVVEKGGSAVCADCHVETATAASGSAVPHVVASECLTCHEPHTSDRPHLLKARVYDLCLSCHDQYGINHPVGRHPLRYATVASTGAEISCASCHLPHGSANASLLKVEGGPMMSCLECHQQ